MSETEKVQNETEQSEVLITNEFGAEKAVEITEFINEDWSGFKGIVKHRLSDFKVLEVGLDGKVVHLTDTLVDPALVKKAPEDVDVITLETLQNALSIDESFLVQLLKYSQDSRSDDPSLLTPELPSKEARTAVHQAIRIIFRGALQSETQDDRIRIYRRQGLGDKRRRDDRNNQHPDQQRFLSFSLHKTNMDTLEAIQFIARRLHMSARDFSYAGTKDRRGVTTQKVVARNVTPAKILGINKLCEDGRLKVSNIQAVREPLCLGDLQGNRFELIIRSVDSEHTNEDLLDAVETFKTDGFINYFGLQRFGTSSIPSHRIGAALLRGDWQSAISLILDPRVGEGDARCAAARKYYQESGNAMVAKEMFPFRYTAERQLLAHLEQSPNDLLGAILAINRELRLMYVHSVQSLIWNRMVSARHRLFGRTLVSGDLVQVGNELVEVTEDNLEECSIENLVLPMPGYESKIPSNIAELYQSALDEFELSPLTDVFRPKNKALWDLPGAYRRCYIIPGDVTCKVGYYADPDMDLDADALSGQFTEGASHRGMYVALTLPSSCYATMALRELMHGTTDPREHKARTIAHQLDQDLDVQDEKLED